MREVNVCLKVLVVMVEVYRQQHHIDFQPQEAVFCAASRVIVMKIARKAVQYIFRSSHRFQACNFIKKETLAQVFSWNLAKFLRTSFLQNFCGRLLLYFHSNEKCNAIPMFSYVKFCFVQDKYIAILHHSQKQETTVNYISFKSNKRYFNLKLKLVNALK